MVLGLVPVAVGVADPAPAAAADSCSGPLTAGQRRVVVVVDPGAGSPAATCVVVASGTTGAQVLARRASQLGRPTPRYDGSGLLCAIDGYPATGCGDRTAGGYRYWAYFTGTSGSWLYGNYNPFIRRVADGDIEGWHFIDGGGNGADDPPRLAPGPSLFPPLTPATTVPPPVTSTGPSGAGTGTGTGGGTTDRSSGGAVSGGAGVVALPPLSSSLPADTTAPPPDAVDGVTEPTTVVPDAASTDDPARSSDLEELAAAPASSSGTDAGRWVGVVLAVVLVAGLAVGGVLRGRARS